MNRRYGVVLGALTVTAVMMACGPNMIVVGDDTVLVSDSATPAIDARFIDAPFHDASSIDAGLIDSSIQEAGPCPALAMPPPSFCDGGPVAPTYDPNGCIIKLRCAPVTCQEGGGTCVALAPGACATGKIGDATKYSCGGLGTQCCLP